MLWLGEGEHGVVVESPFWMTWLIGRPLLPQFDVLFEGDGVGAEESMDDGGS